MCKSFPFAKNPSKLVKAPQRKQNAITQAAVLYRAFAIDKARFDEMSKRADESRARMKAIAATCRKNRDVQEMFERLAGCPISHMV